jgi:molybdenum cofactor synthesis domain-containing protein
MARSGGAPGLMSVAEARRSVLARCRRLGPVPVPLEQALGLVLAEPVRAGQPVPPFANSSMDGYAVRAADVARAPARLRSVGVLMAGDDPEAVALADGEAVRIMTGAALPRGADAVCMIERTRSEGGWVVIEEAVPAGTNIRSVGDDIATGEEVFTAGTRMGAAHVGVIASLGADRVLAHPRARVGVVSTGDELVAGAGPLRLGKIWDSNRPALLAQLRADGFQAVDLGWSGDDPEALARTLREAVRDCDAVLTSGGVSVGDRDIVKVVLENLSQGCSLWLQVAVKPAKPFAFCTLPPDGVPIFGLPGNPVSALVSYELFARPALRLMSGHRILERPRVSAIAEVDLLRRPDGKLHLMRAVISPGPDGLLKVRPLGGQGSHQLRALAGANALALLPDGDGVLAGGTVEVWLLDAEGLGQA